MTDPRHPAVETHNLAVTLARRPILRDVSLTIHPGEVVGILGPNGAGKSTLIKTILGLLDHTSGTVHLAGRPAAGMPPLERATFAAYVPQEREAAWPLAVEDIVALGRLPHRAAFAAPSAADRALIEQAMDEAGVLALRRRPVTELSGGERARVLIARALAQSAPLLLADEPASGLDPAHQLALLALFRRKAAAGHAIALSIHELNLAARWCDRLILLDHGSVSAVGPPESVLTRTNMQSVYGCDALISATPEGPLIIPIPISPGETRPCPC